MACLCLSPSFSHLCQNRGKNKLSPSEEVHISRFIFSHIPLLAQYLICLLPCSFPFVSGLILCAEEQSLFFPPYAQSIILSFVFSSKPISWVVVLLLSSALCIDGPLVFLGKWCCLITVFPACQQLLLEPKPATIGCTITEQQHISNQIHWQKENVLFISQSILADEENEFYLQIRTIACVQ